MKIRSQGWNSYEKKSSWTHFRKRLNNAGRQRDYVSLNFAVELYVVISDFLYQGVNTVPTTAPQTCAHVPPILKRLWLATEAKWNTTYFFDHDATCLFALGCSNCSSTVGSCRGQKQTAGQIWFGAKILIEVALYYCISLYHGRRNFRNSRQWRVHIPHFAFSIAAFAK
eukprot:1825060-Rhodomonas_salina.1